MVLPITGIEYKVKVAHRILVTVMEKQVFHYPIGQLQHIIQQLTLEQSTFLMVKKMPRGDLTSPEEDGETILDWASDNGFGASPIVDALIDRI